MLQHQPLVVIGLPVYNEELHLKEALESVIGQSYINWKLLISDNCSNDSTSDICRDYCSKDSRIVYLKQNSNLGGAENFHQVAIMANETSCDYFMFFRGDAVLSRDYLLKCVESLESFPEASLAYTELEWFDDNSKKISQKKEAYYHSIGLSISQRAAVLLWTKPNQLYGLIRGEYIRIISNKSWWQTIGVDHVLLMELALRGGFCFSKDPVFYRRYTYSGESFKGRMKRYNNSLFNNNVKSWFRKIHIISIINLPLYLISVIIGSELSIKDKLKTIIIVVFTGLLRYMDARGRGV